MDFPYTRDLPIYRRRGCGFGRQTGRMDESKGQAVWAANQLCLEKKVRRQTDVSNAATKVFHVR